MSPVMSPLVLLPHVVCTCRDCCLRFCYYVVLEGHVQGKLRGAADECERYKRHVPGKALYQRVGGSFQSATAPPSFI